MKKKNKPTNAKRREPRSAVRTYIAIIVFGLFIVAGFFFAARQHFSAMDYGMKNSRLRRQVDDLESEKRRLILAREVSLSPLELVKAAKRSGIAVSEPAAAEMVNVSATTKEKAKAPAVPTSTTTVSAKPAVAVKAAAVSPAPRIVAATESKPERERVVKLDKKPAAE